MSYYFAFWNTKSYYLYYSKYVLATSNFFTLTFLRLFFKYLTFTFMYLSYIHSLFEEFLFEALFNMPGTVLDIWSTPTDK